MYHNNNMYERDNDRIRGGYMVCFTVNYRYIYFYYGCRGLSGIGKLWITEFGLSNRLF